MKSKNTIWVVIWMLLALGVQLLKSEQHTSESHEVYLRFANLLPVDSQKLVVNRGSKSFLSGLKPGFLLPYTVVPKDGAMHFSVMSNDLLLGEFDLAQRSSDSFYTVVVLRKSERPIVSLLEDSPASSRDESGNVVSSCRFRGYFGGFEFPYKVDAGAIGQWSVDVDGLVVDVPVIAKAPDSVGVSFETRDGDHAEVFFPIDFSKFNSNSVFVSERGPRRPRVVCFPDNVSPAAESVGLE